MRRKITEKIVKPTDLEIAMGGVKKQLRNLNRSNGRLHLLVQEIKTLAQSIQSSSNIGVQRLQYFENQFIYTGQETKTTDFLRLKIPRGNSQTTLTFITLQSKIQQFIAEFLGIPQTNYTLYYEDDGQIKRADIPPGASQQKIANIYSKNKARTIHLDKEAKRLLDEHKKSIIITTHFNMYVEATQEMLKHKKGMLKSKKVHNMGHLAESFERHWQQHSHNLKTQLIDWDEDELMKNYLASKGNVSWWRGGDVSNKQVKWLGAGGSVKTGSFTSVQELTNYIIWLSEQPVGTEQELEEITKSIAKAFTDPRAVEEYAEGTLAKLLSQLQNSK